MKNIVISVVLYIEYIVLFIRREYTMKKNMIFCTVCAVFLTSCASNTSYAGDAAPDIPKITEEAAAETVFTGDISSQSIGNDNVTSNKNTDDIIIHFTDSNETEIITIEKTAENGSDVTYAASVPDNNHTEPGEYNNLQPLEINGYLIICTSGRNLIVSDDFAPIIIDNIVDYSDKLNGDSVTLRTPIIMESYPIKIPDNAEIVFTGEHHEIDEMSGKIVDDLQKLADMGYTLPETDRLPHENDDLCYDYRVQYVDTDGYVDGMEYPQVKIFDDSAGLTDYIDNNNDIYDKTDLLNAVKKYDSEWFDNNKLLVVLIEEPSGSITHKVTELTDSYVVIDRISPGGGTEDMAEWHILIEVDKDYPFVDESSYEVRFTRNNSN